MKRFLSRAFPRMGPTASTSKDSGFVFALKNMPFVYYPVCLLHKSWKRFSNICYFCAESEAHFHACFEAMKGLYEKIRETPHRSLDGNRLVDQTFSKDKPILIINSMATVTKKEEFEGFKHLLLFLI